MDYETSQVYNEISKNHDNGWCVDCNSVFITYVNSHLKVTLCDQCSDVHKLLFPQPLDYIKSLKFDEWQGSCDVTLLKSVNNRSSNDNLLHAVPIHYNTLTYDSILIYRKYFIFAKYDAKQFSCNVKCFKKFTEESVKEGTLWKRMKIDEIYKERYFVLQYEWLTYYIEPIIKREPKCIIPLDKLDLYLVPDKMEKESGLQLSFLNNNSVRDIYVYSQDPFEIIHWYNVIRAAKLKRLREKHPATAVDNLLKFISGSIIKEGYLQKSGPIASKSLRKRWFILIENGSFHHTKWVLRYYKHPLGSQPQGEILIGKNIFAFRIDLYDSFTGRENDDKTFTLVTQNRSYDLIAETFEERQSWIMHLESVHS